MWCFVSFVQPNVISMVSGDVLENEANMKDSLIMARVEFYSRSLEWPYYFISTNLH